jgi:Ca2+-binding EF-hand superfamily protein
MTRRRINVAFLDKGFVDPLIAKCCVEINKIKDGAELTFENMFNIFDGMRKGHIQRDDFLRCVQGLEMSIAVEDLMEFFNYLDDKMENRISKL